MTDPTPAEAKNESVSRCAPGAAPGKPLTEAARRALEEAAARRAAKAQAQPESLLGPEQGGPKGPEPTRFGDWERKGIAVDFS